MGINSIWQKPHAQNIHEFASVIPHTQYGLHAYKKLITQHDPSPEGHEEQQETLIIIIWGKRGAIPHTLYGLHAHKNNSTLPYAMQCDHPKTQHDPLPEGLHNIIWGNRGINQKLHAQNIHEFASAILWFTCT